MDTLPLDLLPPAILSRPHRITPPYSWCGHIPFAFWTVSALKPGTIVELGTHTGNSFFAFCQAVKENSQHTRCYAVDTWRGDEHAGFYDDSIYDEVRDYATKHYQDIATLIRSTFDEALTQFEDSSVDLLHIDGLHTYEAVKHDFESWLPKLSNRGVVLFHDTHIQDRGFGVWQLWDELSHDYPEFDFSHSCGLGVLGVGKELPSAARRLFSLENEERKQIQTIFCRLGTAVTHEVEMDKAERDTQELEDGVVWLQEQIETRNKDIAWLTSQLAQRTTELDHRNRDIADLKSRLTETTSQLSKSQNDLLSLQASISPAIRILTLLNNLKHAGAHWLKSKIKGTPIAPPVYWLNARIQRIRQHLRNLPNSRQNAAAINQFVQHRTEVLMSPSHIGWLSQKNGDHDLPAIDLSIVTHNSSRWITPFLESLLELDYPASRLAVYFVDNASTDDTVTLLHDFKRNHGEQFATFNVMQQSNLGFGTGHNTAISQGNNEFILVTNVDLTLDKDALKKVIHRAISDDADVASWELRQKPYEHPKFADPVTLEVTWSSHACVLLRRRAYEKVGGYEPRIFMYGEDVELSYRLRSQGYRLRYVPNAVVWHYSYASPSEVKPVQFSGSSLANAYLRLRYGNATDIVAIIPLQLALLIRGGGFPGSRKMVLKNWLKLMKNAPYFLNSRPAQSKAHFPFRAFDYEMTREGAFVELLPLATDEKALPLVSVITRTHGKDDRHLRECIVSVMNQTYPNIEHIIVEDGGNHKQALIEQIRDSYGAKPALKYFPLNKVGRSAAGNTGLSKAEGEYIIFLDEDDLFFPDHIETLYNTLQAFPEIDAAYSLAWDTQTDETRAEQSGFYRELTHNTPAIFYQEFSRGTLQHHNYIPIQAILFKRTLFDQLGGFDETMTHLEDWDLWKKYASIGTFKWVRKTTSLFHTPYDLKIRVQRQTDLDQAYKLAVEKSSAHQKCGSQQPTKTAYLKDRPDKQSLQ